jgi:hypothetical protein
MGMRITAKGKHKAKIAIAQKLANYVAIIDQQGNTGVMVL